MHGRKSVPRTHSALPHCTTAANVPGTVTSRGARYAGRRLAYDHKHRHSRDKGVVYEFTSADQLLKDFFDEVDRVLEEMHK
jgi:hypothetical protein